MPLLISRIDYNAALVQNNLLCSHNAAMMMHNFNSGPSILPKQVLQQAADAIHDFNGIGLSILEIGHRTSWFGEVMDEAQTLVKELMQLNDDYAVLFFHGGASTQFMQVPMNLLEPNRYRSFHHTRCMGQQGHKEAKLFGNVAEIVVPRKTKTIIISRKILPFRMMRNIFTLLPTIRFKEHNGRRYPLPVTPCCRYEQRHLQPSSLNLNSFRSYLCRRTEKCGRRRSEHGGGK